MRQKGGWGVGGRGRLATLCDPLDVEVCDPVGKGNPIHRAFPWLRQDEVHASRNDKYKAFSSPSPLARPLCPTVNFTHNHSIEWLEIPPQMHLLGSASVPSVPFPPALGELLIIHPSVLRRLRRHCIQLLPLAGSPSSALLLYPTLYLFFTQDCLCFHLFH